MTTTDAATTSAIALRLELLGISAPAQVKQSEADRLMSPILARQRELSRRLAHRPCAADQRIQTFLDSYLEGAAVTPRLPRSTFVLDQPGLARALSLPADSTSFTSDYVESRKVLTGVLHNPRNDRRTTAAALEEPYDFIVATVVFMFLQAGRVPDIISNMQQNTARGGYNLIVSAMNTDDYPCPMPFSFTFKENELRDYYQGWELAEYREEPGNMHATDEAGNPIRLKFVTMLARKP